MKMNVTREWIEKMVALEADHDITVGSAKSFYETLAKHDIPTGVSEGQLDDEYGVCEHGRVVHYRYPCRQCLGCSGYLRLRIWGMWNDLRKRWIR